MKKSLSTLILISLVSLFMLPAIMPVMAATGTPIIATGTPIISNLDEMDSLIQKIVDWFSGFVLIVAVLFILVAAWTFLTAGGNPENVAKARQMLIYALIGIAVAVLAWGMVPLVTNILTP